MSTTEDHTVLGAAPCDPQNSFDGITKRFLSPGVRVRVAKSDAQQAAVYSLDHAAFGAQKIRLYDHKQIEPLVHDVWFGSDFASFIARPYGYVNCDTKQVAEILCQYLA